MNLTSRNGLRFAHGAKAILDSAPMEFCRRTGGAGGFWVEDDFEVVWDGEDAAEERRKKLSQLSLGGHH